MASNSTETTTSVSMLSNKFDTYVNNSQSASSVDYVDQAVRLLGIIFGIPVLLLCVLGNLFVLYVTIRTRHFRSSAHVFFASLSVLDLIYGLAYHPMLVVIYIQGHWEYGPRGCAFMFFLYNWYSTSSLAHVLTITITRYLGVVRQRIKNPTDSVSPAVFFVAVTLLIAPTFPVLLSVPALWKGLEAIDEKMVFYLPRTTCLFRTTIASGKSNVFLPLLVVVVIVSIVIFLCHLHIVIIVRRSCRRVGAMIAENAGPAIIAGPSNDQNQFTSSNASTSTTSQMILLRREVSITRTAILGMVNFSISLLLIPILANVDGDLSWQPISFFPAILLQTLSPATNWIIYGLAMTQYRHFYKKLCCRVALCWRA